MTMNSNKKLIILLDKKLITKWTDIINNNLPEKKAREFPKHPDQNEFRTLLIPCRESNPGRANRRVTVGVSVSTSPSWLMIS